MPGVADWAVWPAVALIRRTLNKGWRPSTAHRPTSILERRHQKHGGGVQNKGWKTSSTKPWILRVFSYTSWQYEAACGHGTITGTVSRATTAPGLTKKMSVAS